MQQRKSIKPKAGSLKEQKKDTRRLVVMEKSEKAHVTDVRNESRTVTNPTDVRKIIREYTNNFMPVMDHTA